MTMYHSINMIQDMRKHIYIIMVMLLGCIGQLRAQDAVSIVGYEYWFDTNFDARVKVDTTSDRECDVEGKRVALGRRRTAT